jgi:Holliday junction resolvasome RuvABC endonuclease subunit
MKWIIGIDPSASKVSTESCIGWSLLKFGELNDYGELIPDPPYFTRSRNWLRNKFKMIHVHDPSPVIHVGVETVYLGTNPNVFLGLIQCQSHLCAVTLDAGHTFHFVTPMSSFRAATGLTQYPLNAKGKRSGTRKPTIQAALKLKYGFDEEISEHIYDSIAIALAVYEDQKRESH